jgi:hypothetical protein
MSKKGKRFELDTKNDINANTKPWVKAHRPDFSGNSKGEVADIMVVWQAERYSPQRPCGHPERHVAYGELKKTANVDEGNRYTVLEGSSKDQNGLEELRELRAGSPDWAKCVVGVKFPNRELIVLDAAALEHWVRREEEGWGEQYADAPVWPLEYEGHGARLTPGNNISMKKPELDWWPSSTAGKDDWEKFCLEVGLEEYDFDA